MLCDVAGILKCLSLSFPLPQTADPGSYTCLPHAIVVNLAAFFELWDAFVFHWVKSTQVALNDDDMHDVSRLFVLHLSKLSEMRLHAEHFSFRSHEVKQECFCWHSEYA